MNRPSTTEREFTEPFLNVYGFNDIQLRTARAQWYPGAVDDREGAKRPLHLRPVYIVRPKGWEEEALARTAQPVGVRLVVIHNLQHTPLQR